MPHHFAVRLAETPKPFAQRLAPWLAALLVFLLMGAGAMWSRQQEVGRRVAEQERDVLRLELAAAQASLTAVVVSQAAATAAALARTNEPGPALERALALVYATYEDPSDARLRALADAFSPGALSIMRPEADHLRQNNLKLGGTSGFQVEVLGSAPRGQDRAEVRTRERWQYDERDASGRRARCLVEESEISYVLRRVGATGWLVDTIQVGSSRRTDCPPE